MRTAVCVLGFHRSGTSMTTRLLNLVGVQLGDDLLPPDPTDNPRGFWEPRWMVRFNDEVLAAVGASYMEPPPRDATWERLTALRERAGVLLDANLPDAPRCGFKDPRLCLTWPFWHDLVAERVDAIRYVICVRSPVETAASMVSRGRYPGVSHADWGDLWLEYLSRSLAATRGADRLLVFYEDLLADGAGEARRLAAHLGLPAPGAGVLAEAIDPSMRHHASSLAATAADDRLPAAARAAYTALRTAGDAGAAVADALGAAYGPDRIRLAADRAALLEALAALQAADVREDALKEQLIRQQEQVRQLNAKLADSRRVGAAA